MINIEIIPKPFVGPVVYCYLILRILQLNIVFIKVKQSKESLILSLHLRNYFLCLKSEQTFLNINAEVRKIGRDIIKIKAMASTFRNIKDFKTVGLARSNIQNSKLAFLMYVKVYFR